MTVERWQQARRVLCIRLDYLGDVLMSTPAIRALKESLPGSNVTLLSSAGGAAAARYVPEIDDTIQYAAPWLKSSAAQEAAADFALIEQLSQRRFDAAVIFTVYSQSPLPAALMCHLAGIPLRLAHCRENPYQLLTDWVRETEPQEQVRHEVRRQLDLVAAIGAETRNERLSFRVPPADLAWARNYLRTLDIDDARPWIVLHPGASAPSRRYPPQHWAVLARGLSAQLGCPLVFTGNEDEAALVEQIRGGEAETHSLAGRLDLGRLAALLSLAPLVICNNTGPAHIAAAVGTPIVDLYALTNPQHTPWQVPSRVLFQDVPCRYCYKSVCPQGHHRCLSEVTPERVIAAARELLQEHMPARRLLAN
ncbi:lipopolysaccharide heptosyltransferase II [Noviherbaspirillum sp.]|jgi:lipopolysaccharide heptosyltransferase II|uniref:lipopolysaccharide heptosyltransferase II n=1 Tax=Noviherbaspirillum sp. TaxID=1926288 RepID=UPI0025F06DAE|nr:lipopolysaccharide heptosyltransferase II [Noviherbaspirillum sp.]